MSGYDVFDDPYCYKGTSVLRTELASGTRIPSKRSSSKCRHCDRNSLAQTGVSHPLTTNASTIICFKTFTVGRGSSVSFAPQNPFAFVEHIPSYMDQVFGKLALPDLLPGSSEADFLDAAADFLAELNAIHPFREGNGRSQLSFMHLVGQRADDPLVLTRINRDTFLPAMIASFDRDLGPLRAELQKLLE